MSPFYIGLSLLSNDVGPYGNRPLSNRTLHDEGRRILSLLDGTSLSSTSPIHTEEGGRPYFGDRHADFSISHSERAAAATYYAGDSQNTAVRVGCDIQQVHPAKNREGIARRFFSLPEQKYIAAGAGSRERINRFYHIWVLKESYLKAKGLAVWGMEQVPSFAAENSPHHLGGPGCEMGMSFFLYELGDDRADFFMLAVCLPFSFRPVIRWFSAESLPETSIAEINAVVSPEKTVSPKM
ncbi:MAG: 4'-phosphopantetheinyl transferase superfamily protein [Treponema sp.]|nr:4'-phosphopantetheinyl transferase superfamily protein [Treponema sp.]